MLLELKHQYEQKAVLKGCRTTTFWGKNIENPVVCLAVHLGLLVEFCEALY